MIAFSRYGRALRLLREKKGKSQKQVAAESGITPPMLSAYENERTQPELESLDKVLAGMGATVGELAWALDVVNDRIPVGPTAPASDAERRPSPLRGLGPGLPLDSDVDEARLTPELEAGYAQILAGLVRISRVVFTSVARSGDKPDP